MKKILFNGHAVTEEIKNNTTVWIKQELIFNINDKNKAVDWKATNSYLIKPVKPSEDIKYIDHYYSLSDYLFRCNETDRHDRILNEFCVKRIFLLDEYTYNRLEKGTYPFCAPCVYGCIFQNKYGAKLVKCLKKTYQIFEMT